MWQSYWLQGVTAVSFRDRSRIILHYCYYFWLLGFLCSQLELCVIRDFLGSRRGACRCAALCRTKEERLVSFPMLVVEMFRCINVLCFVDDFEGAHPTIGPNSWLYNEGLAERKVCAVLVRTTGERVLLSWGKLYAPWCLCCCTFCVRKRWWCEELPCL